MFSEEDFEKEANNNSENIEQMRQIIANNFKQKIVFHSAGCSSHALKELCLWPGSSKIILEGGQLYSRGSLELELKRNGVGNVIEKFVSQETSEKMALSAFFKGQKILIQQNEIQEIGNVIGIGITGQIGHHRKNEAYLTLMSQTNLCSFFIGFNQDISSKDQRQSQDEAISNFAFEALLSHCNLEQQKQEQIKGLMKNEKKGVQIQKLRDSSLNIFDWIEHEQCIKNVVLFKRTKNDKIESSAASTSSFQFVVNQQLNDCIIFSGSFNPIHEGHIQIALEAKKIKNRKMIFFEIGLKNPDKAQKDKETILNIIEGIFDKIENEYSDQLLPWEFGVVLSKAALFTEKCQFATNSSFAIGADTFKRILDVKYYQNSEDVKMDSLSTFLKADIDFVLAPRLNSSTQEMESYSQFAYNTPDFLKNKVIELKQFRNDISSTQIRQKMKEEQNKN